MNIQQIQTRGVNLKTGASVLLRSRYESGTDRARFNAVYKAQHYRLCSFAEHQKDQASEGTALLLDNRWRTHRVPLNQVAIGGRI